MSLHLPHVDRIHRERALVLVALSMTVAHSVNEVLLTGDLSGLQMVAAGALSLVLTQLYYEQLGRSVRIACLLPTGGLAFLIGWFAHAFRVFFGRGEPLDYSGLLFALGGGMLIWQAMQLLAAGTQRTPAQAAMPVAQPVLEPGSGGERAL